MAKRKPDALEPVYDWLVNDLGFPFDMCSDKPSWLDTGRLAAKWLERDGTGRETAEDYRAHILDETGWEA